MKNKLYYTYDQLKKDLPSLKDTFIFIASDFEKTINLNTEDYKSLLAQIKRQNIKIKVLNQLDILMKKYIKESVDREVQEYKSRIDKAIKLLKYAGCYDEECKCFCDDVWEELDELLKILEGDDKE